MKASTTQAIATQNPLCELRDWLKARLNLRRSERRFEAAFDLDVASDIAAEAEVHERKIAESAYAAEQSDLEAVKLLESAAADGFTNADMPAVARAIRLIRSSAKRDHAITEAVRA